MAYKLRDLIDVELFQNLLDRLNEIYSFPSSIVDNEGEILTATAWQDICLKFHRKNKASEALCKQSDRYILDHIHEANPAVSYRCAHGLVDTAAPIIINGVHYGNFFTGQYLLDEPDIESFKARAQTYGFDEKAYLEALKKVPVWPKEKQSNYLFLIKGLVALISEIGLKKLRELENRKTMEETETRYQSILQTAMDGFWLTDTKGRILEVNEAYCTMIGYSATELFEMLIHDLDVEGGPDVVNKRIQRVVEDGMIRFETRHRRKDGALVDIEVSAQYITLDGGRIVCFLRDITDRKVMEKALEKRIVSLTRPLDDPQGIEFEDLFNLTDIQRLQDEFARATGVASLITRPDGTPITTPSNFCRLCRNMIRQTEVGLSNCFRSDAEIGRLCMNGPTVQTCLSGGLWDAGAGIEVGGKHLANWLIGQVRDETQTEDKMRLYAREIGADEDELVEAFHEVPAMSREQFGHISRVLFTMANQLSTLAYQNVQQARLISDLKTSEKEQQELQSRLIQAQKLESVGRLAGGVAHDFNNMLSIILGNAEMIREDVNENEPFIEHIEEIIKASRRSIDLTRQLLAFARKQTIAPKKINLNETIDGMLKMLDRLIGEDITLTWRPEINLWPVKIDPTQIDQILANLCANARDGIKGGGRITIETANVTVDELYCQAREGATAGDYVVLSVSDTGCGIDKETMEKLFEPFYTTKDLGKGTGLGLATVYGIVQQNDGRIEVYSEPGLGSSFKIYIPRFKETAGEREGKEAKKDDSRGHETILLVEDEQDLLKMTTLMLRHLGYTVIPASGPSQAIELCESHAGAIDMLMTDVVMPGMSGKELAETLLDSHSDLKVLFTSGYTDNVIAHHGVLDEGIQFINKPFSKQMLSEKIRSVLDPSGRS